MQGEAPLGIEIVPKKVDRSSPHFVIDFEFNGTRAPKDAGLFLTAPKIERALERERLEGLTWGRISFQQMREGQVWLKLLYPYKNKTLDRSLKLQDTAVATRILEKIAHRMETEYPHHKIEIKAYKIQRPARALVKRTGLEWGKEYSWSEFGQIMKKEADRVQALLERRQSRKS